MALTAQQIKDVMDAQADYIDRMYFTQTFGGSTCGMLASTAGFPLWIKVFNESYSTTDDKVYNLWNGSGNNEPPSGWENDYFDDSGWSNASVTPVPAYPPPIDAWDCSSIATAVNPINPSGAQVKMLVRHHFTLPDVPADQQRDGEVHLHVEDRLNYLYINGYYIGQSLSDQTNTNYADLTYTLPKAHLNFGGDNLLAMMVQNSDGNRIGVSYLTTVELQPRALGQYDGNTKEVHSVISGQSGAPGWLGAASDTTNTAVFEFGFDASGGTTYRDFCGKATREYDTSTGWTHYYLENIATAPSTTKKIDVYVGGTRVIEDVRTLPGTYRYNVEGSATGLHSLDYPSRHAFDLGYITSSARGLVAETGTFANSASTTGFSPALYHIFSGDMAKDYMDNYQWEDPNFYAPTCYKDAWMAMNGDQTNTVPNGIDSSGAYFYPHESKTRAKLFGLPLLPSFLLLTRGTGYTRMQWAIKKLMNNPDIDQQYEDPAYGHLPWIWDVSVPGSKYTSPREIADAACSSWDAMSGLGYPNASSDNPYLEKLSGGKASGFTTPQFAIYMSMLGYGLWHTQYQSYADDAIEQLRKATWGCGPYDSAGYGVIEGVQYYRPDHHGGVIPVFSQYTVGGNDRLGHAGKGFADKIVDGITFYDGKLPLILPDDLRKGIESWDGLRQQATDACVVPTTMEATTLCYMANRIYLFYKYHETYPAAIYNGLQMTASFVRGRVVDNNQTPAAPIAGAVVLMFDDLSNTNPMDWGYYRFKNIRAQWGQSVDQSDAAIPPRRRDVALTDVDGRFVLPVTSTGDKTVYIFKPNWEEGLDVYQTNWVAKTLYIDSLDKDYGFPNDIQLKAEIFLG